MTATVLGPLWPTNRRLVRQGLRDPSPEIRLTAVEMAVSDGLERHAEALGRYIAAAPDGDPALGRLREACRQHRWGPDEARWCVLLQEWSGQKASGAVAPVPELQRTRLQPARPSRIAAGAANAAAISALAAGTLLLARVAHVLGPVPLGADAAGHVAKIAMLVRQFPHILWNPDWYAGMPHFTSSYPPLFHLACMTVALTTGMTATGALQIIVAASLFTVVVTAYGSVRALGGSRPGALAAAGFVMASPALMSEPLVLGTDARLFALACMGLAVLAAARWAAQPSRGRLALAATLLAATLLSHLLVGIIGCTAVGALLVAHPDRNIRRRLTRAAAVGLPAAAMSGCFYVPFFLLPRPRTTAPADTAAARWITLFWPSNHTALNALPVTLVPLAVVAGAAGAIGFWRRRYATSPPARWVLRHRLAAPLWTRSDHAGPVTGQTRLDSAPPEAGLAPWDRARTQRPSAVAVGFVGASCIAWALAGHVGVRTGLYGLTSYDFYIYGAWLGAVCLGVACRDRLGRRLTLEVPALAAAGLSLVATLTLLPAAAKRQAPPDPVVPPEAVGRTDFRVGASYDGVSAGLEASHQVPEVRGYQNQGTVNVDWQFWAERALWDGAMTTAEREFTLDWYGVRWVYADDDQAGIRKTLAAQPAQYVQVGIDPSGPIYRRAAAAPVAGASTATTVLVIGASNEYSVVLRALAPSGAGPDALVPVEGGASLDRYTLPDLRRYDAVLLYGATASSWSRANHILDGYVRGGGRLFVEQADSGDVHTLPAVMPVSAVAARTVSSWNFSQQPSAILDGVDPRLFAAPRFAQTGRWRVVGATAIRPWASGVLATNGVDVLVEGTLGRGTVVWSGMNLPFHAASYHNATESDVLVTALTGHDPRQSPPTVVSVARRPGPEEERLLVAPDAKGVLFKETYSKDWRARVDGRAVSIERAGPSFMYVPLDGRAATVVFTYQQGTVERAGWVLTGVACAGLMAWCLGARAPAAGRRLTLRLLGPPQPPAT